MNPPQFVPAMKITIAAAAVFLNLAVLSSYAAAAEKTGEVGFRIGLSHTGLGKNRSKMDIVRSSYGRDKHKISRAKSPFSEMAIVDGSSRSFHARILAGSGEYRMNLSVGTPPVPFTAIVDTGSDLIWTQCMPCITCNRTIPIFDPKRSSSYSNVSCASPLCKALPNSNCAGGCDYTYSYGDASSSQGFLVSDTLTFSPPGSSDAQQQASVPGVGFGCGYSNTGTGLDRGDGLLGLGRGPLSLISQLGVGKFSHCLSSFGATKASVLLVGAPSDPNRTTDDPLKSTAMLKSALQPNFYYVSLEGISVGATRLPIPKSLFEMGSDGSGGMIVDSGTSVTLLTEDAYEMVKSEFSSQVSLNISSASEGSSESHLDLCFALGGKKLEEIQVPTLQFHFTGLDLPLPRENFFIVDAAADTACLAIGPSGGLSILGNVQQQNMLVVYDLQKERLSFTPARCDQL